MKKIKSISYIILILIILGLSYAVYANVAQINDKSPKEKIYSEIEYIETNLTNLFNSANNIQNNNYKIQISEISEKSKQKKDGEESSGQDSSSGGGSGGNSGESGNKSSDSEESKEDYKKFELKSNGVLSEKEDINWDYIKNEVEVMYQSVPTLTIDLYQMNLNKEDILNFNSEYDKLIIASKNENKQDLLNQLSKLYEYINVFISKTSDDALKKNITETKMNVLRAYTKLDSKDWNGMTEDIRNAIEVYSESLTDTNIDSNKKNRINKIYVILNELQNSINSKDESVFLIKYKNLLEEINNL